MGDVLVIALKAGGQAFIVALFLKFLGDIINRVIDEITSSTIKPIIKAHVDSQEAMVQKLCVVDDNVKEVSHKLDTLNNNIINLSDYPKQSNKSSESTHVFEQLL